MRYCSKNSISMTLLPPHRHLRHKPNRGALEVVALVLVAATPSALPNLDGIDVVFNSCRSRLLLGYELRAAVRAVGFQPRLRHRPERVVGHHRFAIPSAPGVCSRTWRGAWNPHSRAAAALREGLEETLTVMRLQLPETLRRVLSSTNLIENLFSARGIARPVTR